MNTRDNSEKIRRMSIAVAQWLCGTLEGITDDNDDRNCTEALDNWLSIQKNKMETLFIGTFTCPKCDKLWEGLTLSEDKYSFNCPNCGSVLKISSRSLKSENATSNIENIKKLQQETTEITQKIVSLNDLLLKSHM